MSVVVNERLELVLPAPRAMCRVDESTFVFTLTGRQLSERIEGTLAQLGQSLSELARVGELNLPVTFGYALAESLQGDARKLFWKAREALATTKIREGARGFEHERLVELKRRLELWSHLDTALEHAHVELRIQPVVDRGGYVRRGHAKLGWKHPVLAETPSEEITKTAEMFGVEPRISHALITQMQREGLSLSRDLPLRLSTRLASSDLRESATLASLEAVAEWQASVRLRIDLEFVGSITPELRPVLGRLRRLGYSLVGSFFEVAFCTADVGLFDALIMEPELVHRMGESGWAASNVFPLIRACGVRGCLIWARGIDNASLLRTTKDLGCDLFEGSHIGLPLDGRSYRELHLGGEALMKRERVPIDAGGP